MLKTLTKDLYIVCETFSNSRNWGHRAKAYYKGQLVAEKKIIYYNRTWERYQFESVMLCLFDILDYNKIVPTSERIAGYNLINK